MEDTLKILFATPECTPFAHSGGLGEVAGSLPGALCRLRPKDGIFRKIDCRVILPLYGSIKEEYRIKMEYLGYTYVALGWRSQYAGLFRLKMGQVVYYFIDNEYYFKRDGLYGYYDDGERFAFFSKAVLDVLPLMEDFAPDIIHANDWQTALIPVYQTALYHLEGLKTVFSVHNIEYQGYYGREMLSDVIGIPEDCSHLLEFNGGINYMKGGIECCNMFSTVSPSYAEELKDPMNAFGMDRIVFRNSFKLRGILNGINTSDYNPAKDSFIAANYSASDMSGKAVCKAALQKELALPEKDVPLITMISRLVPAKGIDILCNVMDAVVGDNDVQFILLGTGNYEYEEWFHEFERRHPDKARSMIMFDNALSHRMYAGGDILLVPSRSEPCGLTQMIGCRYADIPVVRACGGLKDSIKDCTLGEGNGFVFDNYDSDSLYHAIMNAVSRYSDRENWQKLMKYDLSLDFGWSASAKVYRDMYQNL